MVHKNHMPGRQCSVWPQEKWNLCICHPYVQEKWMEKTPQGEGKEETGLRTPPV